MYMQSSLGGTKPTSGELSHEKEEIPNSTPLDTLSCEGDSYTLASVLQIQN